MVNVNPYIRTVVHMADALGVDQVSHLAVNFGAVESQACHGSTKCSLALQGR